jgi:hypothetical protein
MMLLAQWQAVWRKKKTVQTGKNKFNVTILVTACKDKV